MDVKSAGSLPPPRNFNKLRLYTVKMNPYGHRILLILEAKQVPYEVYYINPHSKPEWFLDKCPLAKIPTLEIPPSMGGGIVYESLVIVEYINDVYPSPPLHSKDPYTRAMDRLLVEKFNIVITGMLDAYDTRGFFGATEILSGLQEFENVLAERNTTFYGGRAPGTVDYMIWPWLERISLWQLADESYYSDKKRKFPLLNQWEETMKKNPAVIKHAHSIEEYYNYYKDAVVQRMDWNM